MTVTAWGVGAAAGVVVLLLLLHAAYREGVSHGAGQVGYWRQEAMDANERANRYLRVLCARPFPQRAHPVRQGYPDGQTPVLPRRRPLPVPPKLPVETLRWQNPAPPARTYRAPALTSREAS